MRPPLLSSPLRTLLAGTLLAASALVLALVGGNIGVPEPWPVLLVVGAGLLVGIPTLRHGLALAVGASIGLVTVWSGVVALPDTTRGTALATGVAVLLITVVTLATGGGLRFGLQLVGWAAMTALAGPLVAQGGQASTGSGQLLTVYATVLIASGLGLLVAQVAQLLASGVSGPDRSPPQRTERRADRTDPPGGSGALAGFAAVSLALGATLAAIGSMSAAALADDATAPRPVVHHQQLIVRTHAPDGTPARGSVVTRVGAEGMDAVTVVLEDQAVGGLRVLSRFGAPEVDRLRVTHELTGGAAVRTIADLARALPASIEVAYRLDGAPIAPAALRGRSGLLEVTYTLTNRTAEPRELRFFDAKGRARTVTRDVSVPLAGTLGVTLDERSVGVRSDDLRVVIGRSAQRELLGEVMLFGPAGSSVQTFTWSGEVRDAVVPGVQVRLVPVRVVDDDAVAGAGVGAVAEQADTFAGVLRDLADSGGLLRTGLEALGSEDVDPASLAQLGSVLDGLLDTAVLASADINEMRALLVAQEQRRLDGDGLVHGLLVGAGLPAGVRVVSGVVYVLDVAGTSDDGGPTLPLRFTLAIVLLAAVGLLGRAVGALTGAGGQARTTPQEP